MVSRRGSGRRVERAVGERQHARVDHRDRFDHGPEPPLESELYFSAASAREIAIEFALGKLSLPLPPAQYVPSRMASSGVRGLAVTHSHALHVATLPHHQRDPFDRLLVAQTQLEELPILTADQQLASYDVTIHWAT